VKGIPFTGFCVRRLKTRLNCLRQRAPQGERCLVC